MKKSTYIYVLLLAYILFYNFNYAHSEEIDIVKIKFELPNSDWKLTKQHKLKDMDWFYYERDAIENSEKIKIVPSISFIVEDIDESMSLLAFTKAKNEQAKFYINKVFTNKDNEKLLNIDSAVGYRGIYFDKSNFEHTVYIIHFKNNQKGVQIVFDITSDVFTKLDDEFIKVMRSLAIID